MDHRIHSLVTMKNLWLCTRGTNFSVSSSTFFPLCWGLVERNKYNLKGSCFASVIWNLSPGHPLAEKYLHRAFSSSCWPSAQVEPMLAPPLTLVAWILVRAAARIWFTIGSKKKRIWFTRFRLGLVGHVCCLRLVCIDEEWNSYLDTQREHISKSG